MCFILLYILKINLSRFLHIYIYIDWHIYFPEILFPIIFYCLPISGFVFVSVFSRFYFPLYPTILSPIFLWWIGYSLSCGFISLCRPLISLVTHCRSMYIFILDDLSIFPRSYFFFFLSLYGDLFWIQWSVSRGLTALYFL